MSLGRPIRQWGWIQAVALLASVGCNQFTTDADLADLFPKHETAHPRARMTGTQTQPLKTSHTQLFASARQAETAGNLESAVRRYEQLTKQFPEDAKALHRLAVLYDRTGQSDRSASMYLAAMKYQPDDAELLCDYGYSRYLQSDHVLAERTLRRAIQLDPELARAHTNLALVLARQGNDEEANRAFQTAGQSSQEAAASLRRARTASRLGASGTSTSDLSATSRKTAAALPTRR